MYLAMQVRGEGAHVVIEVLGYENPLATTHSDANWLKCIVSASVAGFVVNFPVSITTQDVASFSVALEKVLAAGRGSAVLNTDEAQVGIKLDLMATGRARVTGELKSGSPCPGGTLTFCFESDQSFAKQTSREVSLVHEAFPVRQLVEGN